MPSKTLSGGTLMSPTRMTTNKIFYSGHIYHVQLGRDGRLCAQQRQKGAGGLLHSYLLICQRNMFEPVYHPLLNDIDRLQARFSHVKLALFAFGWLARRGVFDAAKAVLSRNWRYHVDVTSVCQFWEDTV